MNKQQQRALELDRHYARLTQLSAACGGTLIGKALSNKLRAIENKAHTISEAYCNGDIDSDTWEIESAKIGAMVERLLPHLCGFFVNSDPRGYALKITTKVAAEKFPYLSRDWGGYGILSPEIV